MKNSMKIMIFALMLGLVLISSSEAQDKKMYSWTDENGTVHFSDAQPDVQEFREEVIPEEASSSADNPYAQTAEQPGTSLADQRREDITAKHQAQAATQAMTDAECAAWQAEVARLEPNRRVFTTDDKGETSRMDDQVRVDRVASLKDQISSKCK